MTACREEALEPSVPAIDESGVIHIGGLDLSDAISITSEVSTRADEDVVAVDAETVEWLLPSLKSGLDITYGKVVSNQEEDPQERVAILKLVDSDPDVVGDPDYDQIGDFAVYSFNLRSADGSETNEPAKWRGNGAHYFQGLFVPQEIRYTSDVSEIETKAPGLATDQSGQNYTTLSHYLGMAADTRLQATVGRIKLPFRHRLSHVVAYILIDPILNGAKIQGYTDNPVKDDEGNEIVDSKGYPMIDEDPSTSSIFFRDVKVLRGVRDELDPTTKLHNLTPYWGEPASRVTPHFFGLHGSENKKGEVLEHDFYMYINNDITSSNSDLANIYPSNDNWQTAHNAWNAKYNDGTKDTEEDKISHANSTSGYTRVAYGLVPCYDIIVRPTYKQADNVMYDELNVATQREELAALTNKIDFDITLDNGLQYTKEYEFDLNANFQTVVYLRISREKVDYNDSGSDKWIEKSQQDGWYGLNNKNGNTLSYAGSSWQRAYTYGYEVSETPGTNTGVTDGQFYDASKPHEENLNAQYFTTAEAHHDAWVEKFLQACQGGAHHGDYFALRNDITIDARLIPEGFVFTGHLDAQDHTITLSNVGGKVIDVPEHYEVTTDYTLSPLYSDEQGTVFNVPSDLYICTKAATYYTEEDELPEGKQVGDEKTPAEYASASPSIADLMNSANTYYQLVDGKYVEYVKPAALYKYIAEVSHTASTYLFAGLNGSYTTAQEANPAIPVWEANVHRESNDSGNHWVPTLGYRAELINVKMAAGATLFKPEATTTGTNPDITGNVQNCWNATDRIPDVTPALPDYK